MQRCFGRVIGLPIISCLVAHVRSMRTQFEETENISDEMHVDMHALSEAEGKISYEIHGSTNWTRPAHHSFQAERLVSALPQVAQTADDLDMSQIAQTQNFSSRALVAMVDSEVLWAGVWPRTLGSCPDDVVKGGRVGCKAKVGGCSCGWFEHCYPNIGEVGAGASLKVTDFGVCDVALPVYIVVSLVLFAGLLAFVILTRLYFQHQEMLTEARAEQVKGTEGRTLNR